MAGRGGRSPSAVVGAGSCRGDAHCAITRPRSLIRAHALPMNDSTHLCRLRWRHRAFPRSHPASRSTAARTQRTTGPSRSHPQRGPGLRAARRPPRPPPAPPSNGCVRLSMMKVRPGAWGRPPPPCLHSTPTQPQPPPLLPRRPAGEPVQKIQNCVGERRGGQRAAAPTARRPRESQGAIGWRRAPACWLRQHAPAPCCIAAATPAPGSQAGARTPAACAVPLLNVAASRRRSTALAPSTSPSTSCLLQLPTGVEQEVRLPAQHSLVASPPRHPFAPAVSLVTRRPFGARSFLSPAPLPPRF